MSKHYETDDVNFPADAYRIEGYKGIAWYVLGWETEPDADTEWSGYEVKTGRIIAVMIGDDRHFSFDPAEVHAIEPDSFCRTCGQIGCGCNVYV